VRGQAGPTSKSWSPAGYLVSEDLLVKPVKFTYWKDGDFYLGSLNDYPDYETQGLSKEELMSNLKELLADIQSGEVPYVRKVEELVVGECSAAT
jgi:hypothetical protein